MAEIRRSELKVAVTRLAPSAVVRQLDTPDGEVGSAVDRLAVEIGSAVDRPAVPAVAGASGAVLLAPWSEDRHPDHAAASAAARRVAAERGCRLLEYPVWAWHWARPDDGTFRPEQLIRHVLSANAAVAKDSAIGEYRSQVLPLSPAAGDEAVVQQQFLEHFRRPVEMFVAVSTKIRAMTRAVLPMARRPVRLEARVWTGPTSMSSTPPVTTPGVSRVAGMKRASVR